MNHLGDDQRITAYLTGELNAFERDRFESDLKGNPGLAAEVDEMRELFGMVENALATEPCPQLTKNERDGVLNQAQPAPPPKKFPGRAMALAAPT